MLTRASFVVTCKSSLGYLPPAEFAQQPCTIFPHACISNCVDGAGCNPAATSRSFVVRHLDS